MANRLYNQFGRQNNPIEQLAQQAREFQKQFKGSPRQEVERLLQTGAMSRIIIWLMFRIMDCIFCFE